jgi:hypothetical protein
MIRLTMFLYSQPSVPVVVNPDKITWFRQLTVKVFNRNEDSVGIHTDVPVTVIDFGGGDESSIYVTETPDEINRAIYWSRQPEALS